MSHYKIIIVDENAILRSAIRILIGRIPDMHVVEEATNGNHLLNKLQESRCDLLWMDTALPDVDGIEILSHIRKIYPNTKVMIYTNEHEKDHIEQLFNLKVHGILLKDDYFFTIPIAIKAILEGGTYYSENIIY